MNDFVGAGVSASVEKLRSDESAACSTSAKVEDLLHTISSFRAQQKCLLKALQECQALIATEIQQMQTKSRDYIGRSEEASLSRYVLHV